MHGGIADRHAVRSNPALLGLRRPAVLEFKHLKVLPVDVEDLPRLFEKRLGYGPGRLDGQSLRPEAVNETDMITDGPSVRNRRLARFIAGRDLNQKNCESDDGREPDQEAFAEDAGAKSCRLVESADRLRERKHEFHR